MVRWLTLVLVLLLAVLSPAVLVTVASADGGDQSHPAHGHPEGPPPGHGPPVTAPLPPQPERHPAAPAVNPAPAAPVPAQVHEAPRSAPAAPAAAAPAITVSAPPPPPQPARREPASLPAQAAVQPVNATAPAPAAEPAQLQYHAATVASQPAVVSAAPHNAEEAAPAVRQASAAPAHQQPAVRTSAVETTAPAGTAGNRHEPNPAHADVVPQPHAPLDTHAVRTVDETPRSEPPAQAIDAAQPAESGGAGPAARHKSNHADEPDAGDHDRSGRQEARAEHERRDGHPPADRGRGHHKFDEPRRLAELDQPAEQHLPGQVTPALTTPLSPPATMPTNEPPTKPAGMPSAPRAGDAGQTSDRTGRYAATDVASASAIALPLLTAAIPLDLHVSLMLDPPAASRAAPASAGAPARIDPAVRLLVRAGPVTSREYPQQWPPAADARLEARPAAGDESRRALVAGQILGRTAGGGPAPGLVAATRSAAPRVAPCACLTVDPRGAGSAQVEPAVVAEARAPAGSEDGTVADQPIAPQAPDLPVPISQASAPPAAAPAAPAGGPGGSLSGQGHGSSATAWLSSFSLPLPVLRGVRLVLLSLPGPASPTYAPLTPPG